MDWEEFRINAHKAIDDICDYYKMLETQNLQSKVEPGYLRSLLPNHAPNAPESFESVRQDLFKHILPGITHWQHPSFFAYYPSNSSPPAMLAEMYSNMFNCIGFNWACSPAYTELETITLDWLCKALKLDNQFLSSGKGCGIIQGSASEALLVALLSARKEKLQDHKLETLVFYCSDQTHSSARKASNIALTTLHVVKTNGTGVMEESALENAIDEDIKKGLVPCFCVGTYGTTTSGAVDEIERIGKLCQKYKMWFHIDAAYAGAFLIHDNFHCPTEDADSFNMNTHKMMLTNFDCSPLWVKDRSKVVDALSISAPYYRNKQSENGLVTDYRDLQLPLGRRFRALKLWFVLRIYGIKNIQLHIQKHLEFSDYIENCVLANPNLKLLSRNFALVTFAHADSNKTQKLHEIINSHNVLTTMSNLHGNEILRFVPGSLQTEQSHVEQFWQIVEKGISQIN
eukprot:NODE_62_length_26495_cov_0.832853.p7 type:complete len:457 gc:universal NODE_62_length_26495_cov_0.832853:16769-18139(+)